MRKVILMGLMAAAGTLVIPMLFTGFMGAWPQAEAELPQVTEAILTEPPQDPETRKITSIVVHQDTTPTETDQEEAVTVLVGDEPREMTLEEYLVGVLMGEMPASYPIEALKAQAVAARTYTLQQLQAGKALSDDPSVCQAFVPPEDAEEKLGTEAEYYMDKLRQAVRETEGQVLTYEGELITATYFSCSGGRTESAQAVWGGQVPYLVSVDSPGEEDSGSYESAVTVSMEDFLETLGVDSPAVSQVTYTDGGGVDTMTIGGQEFSGTELRGLFSLRSTVFSVEVTADTVEFDVRGFGHRVGMSQNGARVMAEAGSSYEDILTWYYTGVEIERWG